MSFVRIQWPEDHRPALGGEWLKWRSQLYGGKARDMGLPTRSGSSFSVAHIAKVLQLEPVRGADAMSRVGAVINHRADQLREELGLVSKQVCFAAVIERPFQEYGDLLTTLAILSRARGSAVDFNRPINWHYILNPAYYKGGPGEWGFSWDWNIAVWKGNAS